MIDEDIIRQIVDADGGGEDKVVVYIPEFKYEGWPLSTSLGGARTAHALYHHGIISKEIEVKFCMDKDKNREFHL